MSNAETKSLPAFRIYSVMKNGDDKSTWTDIGVAFQHKDQKGFNLVFNARPLEGAQIVLRQPKEKSENSSRSMTGLYEEFSSADFENCASLR